MTGSVLDLISPSAVSRVLAAAGHTRDSKVGHQRRPYEPLPRTGGYRVTQPGPPWRVEVWVRQANHQARAQTYADIAETLTAGGYQASPSTSRPDDALTVTRTRTPTPEEWAALDQLASEPRIVTAETISDSPMCGIPGIPAEVLSALTRSDLVSIGKGLPVLRQPRSDTRAQRAYTVSLSTDGAALLVARNEARAVRGMWAMIAPEHREAEPPPLVAGDPLAKR